MKPEDHILNIFQRLQGSKPTEIFAKLNYGEPGILRKHGRTTIHSGILGTASRHIWSKTWCFYELALPVPPAEYYGSVNYICFSNNKQCGSGKHTESVWRILEEFCQAEPRFTLNERGLSFVGLYRRYFREDYSEFPEREAFDDLKTLIEGTFHQLNLLPV
jgi:hypothetical protein